MTAKLSDEQRQAIQQENGTPVYVVDTESQSKYVLISVEDYQRVRALFETDDFDISDTYVLQDNVAEEAWSHPDDAAYDDYDAHRKEQ